MAAPSTGGRQARLAWALIRCVRGGQALFKMEWSVAEHRRVMQAEGLRKQWEGPRESGYSNMRKVCSGVRAVKRARGVPCGHGGMRKRLPEAREISSTRAL